MSRILRASIIVLLSFTFTTACTVAERIATPRPWGLADAPEGSPVFKRGWNDGCETGMTTYGNDVYKITYGWKQDPKMVLNDEYYRAWKDAYTYCRWYVYNWARNPRQ